MAVLSLPTVPTLEPCKAALAAAVQSLMAEAITDLAAYFPSTPLNLRVPRDITMTTVTDWTLVVNWPTLTIEGSYLRPVETAAQGTVTVWRGHIELQFFEKNANISDLGLMLDRYAALLWAIVTHASMHDMLEGCIVDAPTFVMEASEPRYNSATDRAVMVAFDVLFRT